MSWQFSTEDWFEVEVMLFLLWTEAEAEAIREIDAETELFILSFKNFRCLISYPFEVEIEIDVKGDCEAVCSWRRSWLLVHSDIWVVVEAPDNLIQFVFSPTDDASTVDDDDDDN
ncbi:hypothetical protein L6452_36909 [Arctium lappa]|uniref:Uncharacterized protein n=1 Tax=Arctium lappa TaxID=4217 RepID=A0ACB8Y0S5_ARCLA|nr:hypothetical protein L6452_36909 [Arctium lappa]